MKNRIFPLSALSIALCHLSVSHASQWQYTQSDFGGVGLMQMPTGRFAPVGAFATGATVNSEYRHYHLSLQLMPWLETTVRYTQVPDYRYNSNPEFSGDNVYTDKGFDLKLRLLEESYWLPELAVGLRDIGGTGLFDGEYIAASKRFGPVDFTLGVGWGYIGNSGNLSGNKDTNANCNRDTSYGGKGGLIDYGRWFSGCAAVFGGIEYQTPWQPLKLKLEYDGNDYQSDFLTVKNIPVIQDSKFNYGVVYQYKDWAEVRASYERGNTWTLGLTLKTNFDTLSQPWVDNPAPEYVAKTINQEQIDWQQTAKDLSEIAGYQQAKIYADAEKVTVVARQNKYRDRKTAEARAALLLANTGSKVKTYQLIETKPEFSVRQTDIDVSAYFDYINQEKIGASFNDAIHYKNPKKHAVTSMSKKADLSKPWSFSLSPSLRQSFGSSEDFYLFNLGINAAGDYWLGNKINASANVYVNIYDNYDKFLYETPPDGTNLKRVRTLIRQYISDNPVRLDNLQLTYLDRFGDNFYTQAYAGYLETMFAGVGGELLYHPFASNWAFGLDLNYVMQRDPDSQFGIFTKEKQFDSRNNRAYRVQTGTVTGHVTAFYRPQWSYFDNFLVKVSAGRYLTDDIGATIDISKQFKSGVIVGAYAAKTNLSADEFGEGSFNKGFYISVPLDLMTVKPTTSRANISWAPLTRDGGQMLRRKYHLYDLTSSRYSGAEFTNNAFKN